MVSVLEQDLDTCNLLSWQTPFFLEDGLLLSDRNLAPQCQGNCRLYYKNLV